MALTAKKVYAILKRQISDMEAKLNSPVRYRGTVATADLLPLNPDIGDMYNIESKSVYGEAGMNVAWNGVVWDTMGAPIDMSLYIKSNELADWVKQQNKPTYTANEVGALPADTKIPSKTSELKNDSGFLTKVPDNYLNGTDTTLKESGKAADAKATGDKFTEMSADISKKLDKNQGSENSGKIAGINESGDIVPMFPVGVEYNEETNCLEFGSDQKMELNQGIGLDSTLTKTGSAADAGATGKEINSLKEDISNKITKFYASNQGENHLADSDNGKIMDMMIYGKSEQKQYTGYQLLNDIFEKGSIDVNTGELVESDSNLRTKFFSKIEAGKEYHIELPKDVTIAFRYYADESTYISSYAASNSTRFSTPESATLLKAVLINNNIYSNNILLSDVMDSYIYEPYTGGIPSPNPDYPQEIKSVVNPTVRVFGGTLGNKLNNKQINWLIENINIWHDNIHFVLYDEFGINGSIRLVICVYENDINNYLCTFIDTDGNITTGRYQINAIDNNGKNRFIYCNMLTITDAYNVSKVVDVDSNKTVGLPNNYQTATLPYTLNAIPVESGGNVTIDGQQYIADYVDVERGKLVKKLKSFTISDIEAISTWGVNENADNITGFYFYTSKNGLPKTNNDIMTSTILRYVNNAWGGKNVGCAMSQDDNNYAILSVPTNMLEDISSDENACASLVKICENTNAIFFYIMTSPIETDLAPEEITAFRSLVTYYPTTNISVNSEQLDGYTVFNYPISLANGWNYVKQQLNDNRDYIYDMDLQSAEAYVNSEYAVTLTELEV